MNESNDAATIAQSATPNGESAAAVAAVILAAGKSTRMRSKLPKPLHPICGLPMTQHVVRACRAAGVERIVVVVGHEAELVREGLGGGVEYALQQTPRGTGDAVLAAKPLLQDWPGDILVLAGDIPMLKSETLQALLDRHRSGGCAATMLTAMLDDATGYGRILRDESGCVAGIVEEKDATPDQRRIQEWNPSIYVFDSPSLWPALAELTPNNAQGEYYLTDIVKSFVGQGRVVDSSRVDDALDVLGVNNRVELAAAGARMRERILNQLMLSGVTIVDPATTYVDADVRVGQDTLIEPSTFLLGDTVIGEDCHIGPFARIAASRIGNGVRVLASQIVESDLEDGVRVGPFSNLRPKSRLGARVKIGDFVETKNAVLGEGVSASHLAYIGDASVGAGTNLGAGTITCNYDGVYKYRTEIGERVFVGSNSTLVAPVSIGNGAFVAAGSVVTEPVPPDALVVARSYPTLKPEWAARRRERLAAEKQAAGR
jgi:bifunctional UDP-N-acetylglucosamine pyrophosphorylase/glucosamine-1-phosphate N-acetyltransferase